ncbi:hypothetical protein R8Z50_22910 [Longispora sp. K20-0274]|uniref:hypothetical protein n=1 Tax=Longispora sp. K20-0274 TaxID=3088255 RepID=UPI00399B3AAD
MSQRTLQPLDAYAGHTIRVGWDRPLATFFVQVLPPDGKEDEPGSVFVWQGFARGEIRTPEQAIDLISPYAQIPDTLAADLAADRSRACTC